MRTVTKDLLVKRVQRRLSRHCTHADLNEIISVFCDEIKIANGQKHSVTIRGFGCFNITIRKPKLGWDFKNKKSLEVPGRDIVKFRPYYKI